MGALTTAKIAGKGGVNVETIRYYERHGPLPRTPRTPSGRDHGALGKNEETKEQNMAAVLKATVQNLMDLGLSADIHMHKEAPMALDTPARSDLRHHKRRNYLAMVQLAWQDRFGHDQFAKTRSFDISESGLRIEMPEPLQERSYVTIKAEKLGLHGRASVRHCSKHGTKYIVGLEFAAGLRWKPPTPEIEEALQEADALLVSH